MNENRLVRYTDDKMVFGVASGIAVYLNMDPAIIRLLFVILSLMGGPGIVAYIVLAVLMPEEGGVTAAAHVFDDEEIVIKDNA